MKNVAPDPDGLQHMLEYLKKAYRNPPIYIQENGKFYFVKTM
jgi:beta-glucosidase/6-phospho-beta-glucosidase/beta-galactosidase